ncbi:riboflavin synthase [Ampullimonas aquatilis]|uniref:riboflavin synthase n=1 Tax=Ampullimonas aquatilis TaxID=1341549 RepID=UPI003C73CCBB
MFTGIIQAVGEIAEIRPILQGVASGVRLTVKTGGLPLQDVQLGDSIAINGACMTVVQKLDDAFVVDVSQESLSKTTGLSEVGKVNLEKAMTLTDRLGGHLVSGHVDGLGEVVYFAPLAESWVLQIKTPLELARFLAYKGSVVVNGVSLTVNAVEDLSDGCMISINLIPHTMTATNLGQLTAGSRVNLEIDLIARYAERILSLQNIQVG